MQVNPYLFYNGNCEEALNYYQKALGARIEAKMPYGKTFWAKGFGMCVDQFGIPWMVNCPEQG
jgi:uncharacterized glyoxalase superfamily protein PhnB